MYQFDFATIWHVFQVSARYIPISCLIAFLTLLVGLFFGVFLAVMRMSKNPVLSSIARAYILVMRGIPTIVFLILVYHLLVKGIDQLSEQFGWAFNSASVPKFLYAVAALSLSSTAFMGETIRTALLSVPAGQTEAAYSIGMTRYRTMVRIVIPQALPVALPIIGNHLITFIKATALVNVIGIIDILNSAIIEVNASYKHLEAYIATAIIYWLITIVIEKAVKYLTIHATKKVGLEASV